MIINSFGVKQNGLSSKSNNIIIKRNYVDAKLKIIDIIMM